MNICNLEKVFFCWEKNSAKILVFSKQLLFKCLIRNSFFFHTENILTYTGMVSEDETAQGDVFESPFFPNFYPRDLTIEHLIDCRSNDSTECHIEISFSDFQISLQSVMEVKYFRKN